MESVAAPAPAAGSGSRPVFDRRLPGGHPYDPALDQHAASDTDCACVAQNIRYDHRVSPEREAMFDASSRRPRSARELRRGFEDYLRDNVREASDPDFSSHLLNGQNVVVGGTANLKRLDPRIELGRIIRLNALLHPLMVAAEKNPGLFGKTDAFNSPPRFREFLETKCTGSAADSADFVRRVLDGLNLAGARAPYHTNWVARWDQLEPTLSSGAERWATCVGLRLPDPGEWLIVLRYSIEDVGTLVRPTVLDAGWHSCHFPSPRRLAPEIGGHPVDLGPRTHWSSDLLAEYLHAQIEYRFEYWEAAGRRLQKANSSTSCSLINCRSDHRDRLQSKYGPLEDWMS